MEKPVIIDSRIDSISLRDGQTVFLDPSMVTKATMRRARLTIKTETPVEKLLDDGTTEEAIEETLQEVDGYHTNYYTIDEKEPVYTFFAEHPDIEFFKRNLTHIGLSKVIETENNITFVNKKNIKSILLARANVEGDDTKENIHMEIIFYGPEIPDPKNLNENGEPIVENRLFITKTIEKNGFNGYDIMTNEINTF